MALQSGNLSADEWAHVVRVAQPIAVRIGSRCQMKNYGPDEAVSDALLRIFTYFSNPASDIAHLLSVENEKALASLVWRMCECAVLDAKRRNYREQKHSSEFPPADLPARGGSPEELGIARELAERIAARIKGLPSAWQRVAEMRWVDGESIQTIQSVTGWSKRRIERTLAQIKAALNHE